MMEGLPHRRPCELHSAGVPLVARAWAFAMRALWRGGAFPFEEEAADDVGLYGQVVFLLVPGAGQPVVKGRCTPGRLSRQVLLGAHGRRLGKHDNLASTRLGVAVATPVPHPPVIIPPKFTGGLTEGCEVHLLHPLVGHAQPLIVCAHDRGVLNGEKKKMFRFPKKARGHSMCSTMVGGSWRLAVGGSWRLVVGNWRLVAVGGGWRRLVAGGWWLEAVGSGWQLAVGRRWRLAAVGGWRLVVGGWWRLAVDGSWRLAVGGPLGLSLRAVLSKKKKISPLKDAPGACSASP